MVRVLVWYLLGPSVYIYIYICIHTHISTHTCVAAISVFGPCAMRAQTMAKMIESVRRLDSGSAAGYASVLIVRKL